MKIVIFTVSILFSTLSHAELIWLSDDTSADGKSHVFYESESIQRSVDRKFVGAVLVTNYEGDLNIDGKRTKSIKSNVSYDCANFKLKPGDEIYYSEQNAHGNIVLNNSVDPNLTYMPIFMDSYKLKVKKICSL